MHICLLLMNYSLVSKSSSHPVFVLGQLVDCFTKHGSNVYLR